jgi:hypothetical protein
VEAAADVDDVDDDEEVDDDAPIAARKQPAIQRIKETVANRLSMDKQNKLSRKRSHRLEESCFMAEAAGTHEQKFK